MCFYRNFDCLSFISIYLILQCRNLSFVKKILPSSPASPISFIVTKPQDKYYYPGENILKFTSLFAIYLYFMKFNRLLILFYFAFIVPVTFSLLIPLLFPYCQCLLLHGVLLAASLYFSDCSQKYIFSMVLFSHFGEQGKT